MSNTSRFNVPVSVTPQNFLIFISHYNLWKKNLDSDVSKVCISLINTKFIAPVLVAFISAEEDFFKKNSIVFEIQTVKNSTVEKVLSALRGDFLKSNTQILDTYLQNMINCSVEIQRVKTPDHGMKVVDKVLPKVYRRLSKKPTDAVKLGLHWAFWELIDNAGNHGYKSYDLDEYLGTVYVCAFSYTHKVEIVVLDTGQGIAQSLADKNPGVTARQALEFSTRKGTSGHPIKSGGFGLHGSSNLADHSGGIMYIFSNDHGFKIENKNKLTFSINHVPGTIVSLSINAGANFALKDCIQRTEEEYKELHKLEL